MRPYTEKIMDYRAEKLAETFPQYDAKIVEDFSLAVAFYDEKHGIKLGQPLRA